MLRLRKRSSPSDSGQAAVEAALTLPLVVFLILGTIQLFLALQGRILAEYAAFRAARAGSVKHGSCTAMTHTAVLALLPSFHSFLGGAGGTPAAKLAQAFKARSSGLYNPGLDGGHDRAIFWLIRQQPDPDSVPSPEDTEFDAPRDGPPMRMEVRLVYFFPLKVPFANWVIARIAMAEFGLREYRGLNPLMPTQDDAEWTTSGAVTLEGAIAAEVSRRFDRGHYVLPMSASGSLRMMTPAKKKFFLRRNCSPAPESL